MIFTKLKKIFFSIWGDSSNNFSNDSSNDYISIVFKFEDKYFFKTQYLREREVLIPIFVKLYLLGSVEEDLVNIQLRCIEEFNIFPESIHISYNVLSLAPLDSKNYYLAIVDLSKQQQKVLKGFKSIIKSEILLKRDSNIFFDLIAKEI